MPAEDDFIDEEWDEDWDDDFDDDEPLDPFFDAITTLTYINVIRCLRTNAGMKDTEIKRVLEMDDEFWDDLMFAEEEMNDPDDEDDDF